jgi:hypothetical protein
MLVKIRRDWASHLRNIALLTIFPAACSLLIGELPEPLSHVGPMAGEAGAESGGDSQAGAEAAGGTGDFSPGGRASGGGASGGDGPLMTGGVAGSGQGGDLSDGGGAPPGDVGGDGGSTADPCDADRDTHRAQGLCGGDDCDDSDPQVSPDQVGYFAARHPNVDFDYNCNKVPEQEQMAAVVCSSLGPCPTGVSGFLNALPACGELGEWGKCVKTPPLNTCDKMVIDAQRRMRCH